MAGKLNNNWTIRTLASDLRLKPSTEPVSEIIRYCHRQVRRFLSDYPKCANPVELLGIVANKLRTEFREIHSDEDLEAVRAEFLNKKETGFVGIHKELDGRVLGITLKRMAPQPWDLSYVSVIDCRGQNSSRAYYTKWHEIGHLLILTDQNRLVFRRTHTPQQIKPPEESLVDIIAGTLAFYPDMVRANARGEISFDKIDQLRQELCPSASYSSALLGISKAWPSPCILVDARLGHKAGETEGSQQKFSFRAGPAPTLRAVHVTPNDAARKMGIVTIRNFRVPSGSIIYRVFHDGLSYEEAVEELSSWSSSGGKRWSSGPVLVKARNFGDNVQALLIPISSPRH